MGGLIPFNRNKSSIRPNSFEDVYNMLDDFFNDTWAIRRSLFSDTFKIDVRETNNEYLIEAELPGVKKEEVHLDLNDNRLTISVKREENTDLEKKGFIHKERRISSMQRCVYLQDAKAQGAKAQLSDGVLKISVAKDEKPSNSYNIDIQ